MAQVMHTEDQASDHMFIKTTVVVVVANIKDEMLNLKK